MEKLPGAEEFYMDSISRVTTEHYSKGRVVLLGDAAYGNTLGGFGTGLAIVGAYVLARELFRANGDYKVAYAQYEAKFRGYAKVSQKVNAGPLLAPSTRLGTYVRNRVFSVAALFTVLIKLMDHLGVQVALGTPSGLLNVPCSVDVVGQPMLAVYVQTTLSSERNPSH